MNLLLPSPKPIQGFLPITSPLHDPSKIQLSVQSAHTYLQRRYMIDVICSNIIKRTHKLSFNRRLAINAVNSLVASINSKRNIHFPEKWISIPGVECTKKDKAIIAECLRLGCSTDAVRHSVTLAVEPTLTIDALKSLLQLQSHPWIPRDDLILVKNPENTPIDDGKATLVECGVKDNDTLLACMGGSFTLSVHDFFGCQDYYIPVSSCFEKIHAVKEQIHRITGFPPEYQILHYRKQQLPSDGGIPLVSLGIVRPYMNEIYTHLSLEIQAKMQPGVEYM